VLAPITPHCRRGSCATFAVCALGTGRRFGSRRRYCADSTLPGRLRRNQLLLQRFEPCADNRDVVDTAVAVRAGNQSFAELVEVAFFYGQSGDVGV
jgi:hypothetical protein